MLLNSIWQGVDTSNYILGNTKERRAVIFSSGEEKFTLPVTPYKYQVQTAQDNKTFDVLDTGEILLFGNPKLKRLRFNSFFPALKHKYPFVVGDKLETSDCIALFIKWKEQKSSVRVIITDSPINLQMAIDTFNYQEKDGTRDIYFDIDLTEYKDLNTPRALNSQVTDTLTGLKNRPNADRATDSISFLINNNASDVFEAARYAGITVQNFIQKNNIANMVRNFTPNLIMNWKI